MSGRRGYLDWLRGIGVLIMIEAHTLDSWTRVAERTRPEFRWAAVLGGFGAPIFLFLAGVALTLAAGSRMKRGMPASDAAALARKRGWQVFGLAFLFRLQSMLLGGGSFESLLKVDILNVMGIAMVAAAVLWGLGRSTAWKAMLLGGGAAVVAMATPIVRATPLFDPLPDAVEWYLRAPGGRAMFTLFPWAGFLLAGSAIGLWLDAAATDRTERSANRWLAVTGPALAIAAYGASFLPSIYERSDFWTSSPTFFFVRLGVLMATLPLAYAARRLWPGRSPIEELGMASLFVYWVHVELVYGLLTLPLHRSLGFEQSVLGFALFSVLIYWLVRLKGRLTGGRPKSKDEQKSVSNPAPAPLSGHRS